MIQKTLESSTWSYFRQVKRGSPGKTSEVRVKTRIERESERETGRVREEKRGVRWWVYIYVCWFPLTYFPRVFLFSYVLGSLYLCVFITCWTDEWKMEGWSWGKLEPLPFLGLDQRRLCNVSRLEREKRSRLIRAEVDKREKNYL